MSAFTLVYTRAAGVNPSNTVNIPFPNMVDSGTITSVAANSLVDSAVNFQNIGIKVGDTAFNTITKKYAIIIQVTPTTLKLSADIFLVAAQDYAIYQGVNNGCYIYVPDQLAGATLGVETIGGDQVTFTSPSTGVLPVQVRKVLEYTTAVNLVALW